MIIPNLHPQTPVKKKMLVIFAQSLKKFATSLPPHSTLLQQQLLKYCSGRPIYKIAIFYTGLLTSKIDILRSFFMSEKE